MLYSFRFFVFPLALPGDHSLSHVSALSQYNISGLSQTCAPGEARAQARRSRARTPHTCPVTPSTARSTLTALEPAR
eukprot:15216-Prymnesium_polylepis.1